MSRTSRKLSEAAFFLQRLEASITEHPEFDYYFSAFVNSARSVTWVLKAEYKDCPGWLDWYNARKPEATEELLLGTMNALRVRSEKFDPLVTKAALVLDVPAEEVTSELREFLETGVGKRFRAWIGEVPDDGSTPDLPDMPTGATIFRTTLQDFQRHVFELGDQNVLVACALYLATLQGLVTEAQTFANAA